MSLAAYLGKVSKQYRKLTGQSTPPTAGFDHTVDTLTAFFTSTSTAAEGTLASHFWDFDDGGTSETVNPQHTYAGAGTYDVTLTVTDDDGDSDSVILPVTV